ncbi:MAG: alpha/beta hydrolase [Desulfocapsa sp.]|nr:alpha/beta hydrolase [Desulfocapsa sp.]
MTISVKQIFSMFFILFLLFLIVLPVAYARQLVFVFDVSRAMNTQCMVTEDTGLGIVKDKALDLLNEELIMYPQSRVSIVEFSGTSAATKIHALTSWKKIKKSLKELTIDNVAQGSVSLGLQKAMDVLERESTEISEHQKIILFSATKENDQGLLALLSKANQKEITVSFQLFNKQSEEKDGGSLSDTEQKITISSFGCSDQKLFNGYEQKVFFLVRQTISEQLGITLGHISKGTDIIKDLGVDTYGAYEILVMLCDTNNVPIPKNLSLTNIGEISKHIVKEKKNQTRGEGPQLSKSYKKTVYYATDRNVTGNPDPDEYFGTMRSDNSALSYGLCTVSIPESHQLGQIESPFLGLDFFESTEDHFVLLAVTPLSKSEMYSRLGKNSGNSHTDATANDIMVFIHGFNQSFEIVAKRTAQIAVDLDFKGAPFMFSWPSNDSLFDYWADREDVNWSVAHLEQLLIDLNKQFPQKGLHLIAHSMGNQALIGALNRIALQRGPLKDPLFKNIILAAPDFDARLFQEQIAPAVVTLAANWSIYASKNDTALTYSGDINDAKRLGIPLTTLEGMNVIDASGVEVTPWSVPEFHSYFATKMVVVRDMTMSLKGKPPRIRGLIPDSSNPFRWLLKLPKNVMQEKGELLEDSNYLE